MGLLFAAFLSVVVVVVVYVTWPNDTPEKQAALHGKAAINAMADQLNTPLHGIGSSNYEGLNLPENTEEVDFYKFESAWEVAFAHNWNKVLWARSFGDGLGEWPGGIRFMTRAKGDSPDSGVTKCPERNNDNRAVTPESLIFYCVEDSTRHPGKVLYPQGTFWIPIAELTRLWREVRSNGTGLTHAQQVAQAAFVQLTALWGDALTRQIRVYAAQQNIHLSVFEEEQATLVFGFCVAGAMGRTVFGTANGGVAANALPPNAQNDPVLAAKTKALKLGFQSNSLGACITAYWPEVDTP